MSLIASPYIFLVGVLSAVFLWRRQQALKSNPRRLPRPPGPPGYPIIGNLLDVPAQSDFPWLVYRDWGRKYGDMIYYEVLGQPFLVLNSLRRADDLLEKRAKNYSDRLHLPMLVDLMGWGFDFAILPYGALWRRYRRPFHENFHSSAILRYRPIQLDEARALAVRLLGNPTAKSLFHHVRRSFAGTIMRVTYGIPVSGDDDKYIARAEIALAGFSEAGIPGTFWVDFFPFLKHIPSWFPGASFKRKAAYWKSVNHDVCTIPFNAVKEQLKTGEAPPSVTANLINSLPPEGSANRAEEEEIATGVAAVAYAAGADTTLSIVQAFFIAIAMHPEVLSKAHSELDRVVGRDRLPEFEDRDSLPYIQAICKEVMRWHQVTPLALPHMTTEDDEYDGYFIPKGTVVLGNAWAILHDPEHFEDPLEFRPERYMKGDTFNRATLDPVTGGAFGFGRRICPGRHLSDGSLFAVVSTVLSVYDIAAPVDMNGERVKVTYAGSSGLLCYPVPTGCDVRPRDKHAERLIKEVVPDAGY